MKLDHIALDRLSISPANMRSGKKPPDISGILPSIRARGIIMPLLVRPNGSDTTFEIVAGSRRFLAAQTVANENGVAEPLPCAIMEAGDDAAALEASLIENLARLAPDEVTQWESFTRLVKEGRTPDEISMTFGMPELTVKRILALGNLLPRIRQLYRAEEIDATSVRHLTLATKAQQKTWLALYDDPQASIPKGHQLKAWLFGGASISTSVALFDLETYQGRIVKDLFEKDGYFGEVSEFEDAQRRGHRRAQSGLYRGWLERCYRFARWAILPTLRVCGHSQAQRRAGLCDHCSQWRGGVSRRLSDRARVKAHRQGRSAGSAVKTDPPRNHRSHDQLHRPAPPCGGAFGACRQYWHGAACYGRPRDLRFAAVAGGRAEPAVAQRCHYRER